MTASTTMCARRSDDSDRAASSCRTRRTATAPKQEDPSPDTRSGSDMDAEEANDLSAPADGPEADDAVLADDAAWAALTKQIEEIVSGDYDLGDVVRAERIFGGYVNASFAVWTHTASGEHKSLVRKNTSAIKQREVSLADH